MRRIVADCIANYVFFVPLVLVLNRGWRWPEDVLTTYLFTSIVVAAVGGRAFTIFLKWVWYPLWSLRF